MEQYLTDYTGRMRSPYASVPPASAHALASAFLAFRYGMYENAIRECTQALALFTDAAGPGSALRTSLLILRGHAAYRLNAQETGDLGLGFSPAEQVYAAITIAPERVEDPATLALDNALILVWVVALNRSPDDEEALEEHREMIMGMLRDYKKAMGME